MANGAKNKVRKDFTEVPPAVGFVGQKKEAYNGNYVIASCSRCLRQNTQADAENTLRKT